jgi:ABC-type lipoprotein release transport system permease subunit
MTWSRLLLRNLFYHWRGNLAVLLGAAVGTAVLTGALLVGDSLRGSLREQALDQLGWVDNALVAGRFFRAELADELDLNRVSPAILLRGAATKGTGAGSSVNAGRVTILGVDSRFWAFGRQNGTGTVPTTWNSREPKVYLNQALADELAARSGDAVTFHLQKVNPIPRESLLGRRDAREVVDSVELTVAGIIPDRGMGRFNLSPSPEAAHNAFIPLQTLQAELHQEGRANALLVGEGPEDLQDRLRGKLTLEDWGLTVAEPKSRNKEPRGYLSLESRQMLVESAVAESASVAAAKTNLAIAPTLVYLANSISDGAQQIPYSVVAALDPTLSSPLGPFLPAGTTRLLDSEIVIADWHESPLRLKPGDPLTLFFYKPEDEGRLQEVTATFKFKGLIPLEGPADDPNLTPAFPGITDRLSLKDWDPPFDIKLNRFKDADEQYWKRYRTTPKAYITLAAGQALWKSRFGQLTSIRLAPRAGRGPLAEREGHNLTRHLAAFRQALLENLRPDQGGLVFDDLRKRSLDASIGATDFGEYFLYFSCFLIVAALLLVGLLFRLNLDRRASEIGLLLAVGFRPTSVRMLLLVEGALLAAAGGFIGVIGALGYTDLLLALLCNLWPGVLGPSFLQLHFTGWSLGIGYASGLSAAALTIFWAQRVLAKASPRSLLAGEPSTAQGGQVGIVTHGISRWIAGGAAVGALVLTMAGRWIQDHEMQAGTFFGSGFLLLLAFLAGVWAWMRSSRYQGSVRPGRTALARLGVRNAERHPVRSLLTMGLLALAVFVVVAVEAFHRDAAHISKGLKTGTGGFALLAETNLPIYQDLNTDKGRGELNFPDAARSQLKDVRFMACRRRAGDDASCLNLYQPTRPQLLGVPHSFIDMNRFAFSNTLGTSAETRENPWKLLGEDPSDGAIPVFGDSTTVKYMLKKELGGVVQMPNERGEMVSLRIVGLLAESVFQSQLLMSESNFLRMFPSHEGYHFYLIDAPAERIGEIKNLLESALAERGCEVTPTVRRLASFWAVENTYLATFQALGGLGLILGALGLAVVLLRTMWERRAELALLRALGFRHSALGRLLLAENGFLLVLGLAGGVVSALLAVAPHWTSAASPISWTRLGGMLGLVLLVGVATGAAAVATTLRAALVPALRRE